jgi:4-amino-4-deoxy-L-arabinose transferase-like glycosyltransferase
MLVAIGIVPALVCALIAYAVRPAGPVFAPLRLALVRAAVLVGGCTVILVEALSAARALTVPALVLAWIVGLLVAAGAAAWRYRRDGALPRPGTGIWAAAGRAERIMGLALLGLVLSELVVALMSPPNNYDSQTYHLPKIEHWVAQQDVQFFATRIHRQDSIAPGAEYLLLHLRLLTGGDALYNLLQWSAGLGCALLVSRIVGQLGGSRRAQLLGAFVMGTTPIVGLESSSTQTDLVVAAWVGCVATLVLDELRRRTPFVNVALLGAATGLTTLTKATGLLAAGPLLLIWGVVQLRRSVPRTVAGTLLIIGLAAAMAGPFLYRVNAEFGNLLGPDYLRNSISMERHDPASVLVNALRIGHTALNTPVVQVNDAAARTIGDIAHTVGVDPNDSKITFWGSTFPVASWPPDEDLASFPVQGILVLVGAGLLLIRPRRAVDAEAQPTVRAYAGAFWLALLLYVTTVKWQPWGNRLLLFLLMLGAPLAALWLDAVLSRAAAGAVSRRPAGAVPRRPAGTRVPRRRTAAAWAATLALVVGGCAGWLAVWYGWPRRLVGHDSVFTESAIQARFQRRPQWAADYEFVAEAVRASGARTVGLAQGEDTWEYPWWVLLRGDNIVALQSMLHNQPPAKTTDVDAIVCVTTAAVCGYYAPHGWQVHMHGTAGYALPPGKPAPVR